MEYYCMVSEFIDIGLQHYGLIVTINEDDETNISVVFDDEIPVVEVIAPY